MILEIDPTNGVPIFMQIVQQVKYKIATGVLQPEDQLPSVRQLASNLRVNPNTVVRAYTELERDGLVQTQADCVEPSRPRLDRGLPPRN